MSKPITRIEAPRLPPGVESVSIRVPLDLVISLGLVKEINDYKIMIHEQWEKERKAKKRTKSTRRGRKNAA